MQKYKIKGIFTDHLLIEYRTSNGTLKELSVFVKEGWDKHRIEEEINRQKQLEDERDINLNLSQYFSKGDELEFVQCLSEDEEMLAATQKFAEEQRLEDEKYKQEYLQRIIDYRSVKVDYKIVRSHFYPDIHDQIDALYWARQGNTQQLEEIDKKIKEVKEKYPKDSIQDWTYGYLDDNFPEVRSVEYKEDLISKGIEADFL
jgi:hypothetical protein